MTQPAGPVKPTLEQAWRNLMRTIGINNPRRVKNNRIIVNVLRSQQRRRG